MAQWRQGLDTVSLRGVHLAELQYCRQSAGVRSHSAGDPILFFAGKQRRSDPRVASSVVENGVVQFPNSLKPCLDGRLEFAVELARLAGATTLELFQSRQLAVERKSDSSPVTEADRRAEQLIRERLSDRYPLDAILGEEFGSRTGSSSYKWIVDPIDGTKSFISGVPLYSTLIGLVTGHDCLAGVIYLPALDEIVFAARGAGAWYSSRGQDPARCGVSKRSLSDGLFVVSQFDLFGKRNAQAGFESLQQRAYITRSWGDGYGYLLVATGRAEVMVDAIANPWDLAAILPIIEEAGGRFTDWKGNPTAFGGDGVGSNGIVHEEVLQSLRGELSG